MDPSIVVGILTLAGVILKDPINTIVNKLFGRKNKFEKAMEELKKNYEEKFLEIKTHIDNSDQNFLNSINSLKNEVDKKFDNIKNFNVAKERAYLTETYYNRINHGWCPKDLKNVYRDRFLTYRDSGYNHIMESWLDEVLKLPEDPQYVEKRKM